jgi:F-type H+-transporting ATPase subunit alpha
MVRTFKLFTFDEKSQKFMSNLLQEIEAQIAGAKAATAKQNVGVVREIGDGVAKIEGLTDAMLNEMLDFGNGITGLALNLEETEVGAIILGDYTSIKEGDEVRTTGKLLQVPVGKGLLGRVVNALGQPLDGKGPIKSDRVSGRKNRAGHHQTQIRQPAGADGHHGD